MSSDLLRLLSGDTVQDPEDDEDEEKPKLKPKPKPKKSKMKIKIPVIIEDDPIDGAKGVDESRDPTDISKTLLGNTDHDMTDDSMRSETPGDTTEFEPPSGRSSALSMNTDGSGNIFIQPHLMNY